MAPRCAGDRFQPSAGSRPGLRFGDDPQSRARLNRRHGGRVLSPKRGSDEITLDLPRPVVPMLERRRCVCPIAATHCARSGPQLTAPLRAERGRRGRRSLVSWVTATAAPRFPGPSIPGKHRIRSCVGTDVSRVAATSITGLLLGQAERSSHRCRYTRCSNSSISTAPSNWQPAAANNTALSLP